MKITRIYDLKLGTGLWGLHTAEHTAPYIRNVIVEVQQTAKTLLAKQRTISNELIEIEANGTEKQLSKLADAIKRCVITIDDVVERSGRDE